MMYDISHHRGIDGDCSSGFAVDFSQKSDLCGTMIPLFVCFHVDFSQNQIMWNCDPFRSRFLFLSKMYVVETRRGGLCSRTLEGQR